MEKCLLRTTFVLIVIGQATVLSAQVFNAPTPEPMAAVQQAGGTTSAAQTGAVRQTGAVEESSWSGVPLPKITLPKITMPKMTMPNMSSVTGPVKSGFSKVSSGTKKAWEGTKEMFSFANKRSSSTSSSRSRGQKKPSFWSRLIVRETEPRVPQTVGEFMSQPRLDP